MNYTLKWLDESADYNKPFFLYLAYTAPHDPLMAWPEDIEKYKGKFDEGYEVIRKKRYEKQLAMGLINGKYKLSKPTYQDWAELSEDRKKEEARKMEVYAAMIDRMDQNIGRILGKLDELDKADNTLILFVSDNGASAEMVMLQNDDDGAEIGTMTRWVSLGEDWANVGNTPFRFYKNFSYEGGINTPLIAYWPGVIKPNSFSDFPGHFIDIMPTLADIADAEYPLEFNGQKITPARGMSLKEVLKGGNIERDKPLYWSWRNGMAVRAGEWKIVKEGRNKDWSLFNIVEDPTEVFDLAGEHTEIVLRMDSLFREWYSKYYPR